MNRITTSFLFGCALALAGFSTAHAQARPRWNQPQPEIIVGANNIERVRDFDPASAIYRASAPTARISMPDIFGWRSYCTGSLIGEDTLLTGGHCLDKRYREYLVTFAFLNENDEPEAYRVTGVIHYSKKDDIAILRLDGKPGAKYGFYRIAQTAPLPGEKLVIFHHPAGEIKSVSHKDCAFYETRNIYFVHTCDTEIGSSGAPILNERFELVAVHQGGLGTEKYTLNYGHAMSGTRRSR